MPGPGTSVFIVGFYRIPFCLVARRYIPALLSTPAPPVHLSTNGLLQEVEGLFFLWSDLQTDPSVLQEAV